MIVFNKKRLLSRPPLLLMPILTFIEFIVSQYFFKKFPTIKTYEKDYYLNESCNSCGICVDICPTNCIELTGCSPNYPTQFSIDKSKCLFCNECELACVSNSLLWKSKTEEVMALDIKNKKPKKKFPKRGRDGVRGIQA